jgi:hypothetical protein
MPASCGFRRERPLEGDSLRFSDSHAEKHEQENKEFRRVAWLFPKNPPDLFPSC